MSRMRAVAAVAGAVVLAGCSVTDTPAQVPDHLTGTGRQPYYELENSNAPEGLLAAPASPRDVALLACGDALPGREQLNTCSYESVIGMGRYPTEVPRLPRPVRGRHQGVRQGATGGTGRAVHAHRDRAGAAAPLTGSVPWRSIAEDHGRRRRWS